ncbi:aquaporin [Microbacterium paraoxydans]|uniref:aquaporin n=1 Tax=Microbacterium paraoxydans TaxID=199592 RepID=UPI001CFACCF3|nr:aquaporin [Microbacterium paraoxydans]
MTVADSDQAVSAPNVPPTVRTPLTFARLGAEAVGTAVLVVAGVGTGVLSFSMPGGEGLDSGVGILGVAFAVGFSIVAGVLVFGPISGAHFNPAVTVGIAVAGEAPWRTVPAYLAAQLIGGVAGVSLIAFILGQAPGRFDAAVAAGFSANGYGDQSSLGVGVVGVFVVEVLFTALLVMVVLIARTRGTMFAAVAIGLTVVLCCIVTIPVDNTSLNPARSFAAALFAPSTAMEQVWLFFAAPVVGAVLAGVGYRLMRRARTQLERVSRS